ncbi:MAG: hypothetical protein ABS935_03175 [Solibacillus sp.]|uniref:hypothetical protein n=1 Tax=Solibacillus sp. TaxID=1909654 RepID=UPI003315CBBB
MKLTQVQIDAINKALSHYGDADHLVKMHRQLILNGHEWSIWTELNDLSPAVLNHALKYGFEVSESTDEEIKKVLARLKSKNFNNEDILFNHQQWKDEENQILNSVSYDKISRLLMEMDNKQPQQKTQHHMGKVKPKEQKSSRQELELDLDYQLASLHNAMQQGDQLEIERCKKHLAEIHKELESNK